MISTVRRYAFIFNPAARMGQARRRLRALETAIGEAGLQGSLLITERRRHAVDLARDAADGADVVVAVGGDGTVHEVAEGLVMHGGGVPLGVVPFGTGNDFAKMVGAPVGPKAVAALARARVAQADCGRVAWDEGDGTRHGYFFNGLGIGFDARVAGAAARYKHLPGVAGYIVAVFDTLAGWQAPRVSVSLDEAPGYHGRLLLAAIGNGTTAGGGFILTPGASIFDGYLDLCLIRDVPRRRILSLLPTALRGTHVQAPEVEMTRFRTLRLEADAPVAIHADGEVLTSSARAVAVQIVPGGLAVLVSHP